jgi:hypothetical protein
MDSGGGLTVAVKTVGKPYVKRVQRNGRSYYYLAQHVATPDGMTQRTIRKLTEYEAKRFQMKRTTEPVDIGRPESPQSPDISNAHAAGEPSVEMSPPSAEADAEEYSVVERQAGRYVLEPLKPASKKGYVIVTEDERVFCGLCPGFTCSHVEFMHKWLRAYQANPE